jgi:Uma2 family endonuclease
MPPKKKKKIKLPSYVVYEVLQGHALPYKGYKDVLNEKINPESIMGSSGIQALLVYAIGLFLGNNINRKKYFIVTNEAGLHIDKGNNLALDIAVFDKKNTQLVDTYIQSPPEIVIELDIKADLDEAPFSKEELYIVEKSKKLLEFGTKKVIWVTTLSKKIYVATKDDWRIFDFDHDIHVIDDCVLNLEKLMMEEEITI